MKQYILLPLLYALSTMVIAQNSVDTVSTQVDNIKLDMLKSPTNPAFLIMNTSPTEIVEPGSAPEFYTSIQNASDNFSALPNNYGFSATPYWWSKKAKVLSFNRDFDTINSLTFYRTLNVSGGMVQGIGNESSLWRYAIGIQSTLLRGRVDNRKKSEFFSELRNYHENYFGDIESFFKENNEYVILNLEIQNTQSKNKILEKQLDTITSSDSTIIISQMKSLITYLIKLKLRMKSLKETLSEKFDLEKKYIDSNKELDKKFNEMNERVGLKWDIGGGISINSHDNLIDSTGIYRVGFWTNFGGNILKSDSNSSSLSAFMLIRYLYFNDIYYLKDNNAQLINNLHTFDIGAKLQFDVGNRLSVGFETIYRVSLYSSVFENTYKVNGLIQYQIGQNRIIYTSIGNNFNDNSNSGPKDLVVTFGFNIGFGGNVDLYDIKF